MPSGQINVPSVRPLVHACMHAWVHDQCLIPSPPHLPFPQESGLAFFFFTYRGRGGRLDIFFILWIKKIGGDAYGGCLTNHDVSLARSTGHRARARVCYYYSSCNCGQEEHILSMGPATPPLLDKIKPSPRPPLAPPGSDISRSHHSFFFFVPGSRGGWVERKKRKKEKKEVSRVFVEGETCI